MPHTNGLYRKNKYKSKDEGAAKNDKIVTQRGQKAAEKRRAKQNKEKSIESVVAKYKDLEKVNTASLKSFSDLPISTQTLKGLEECEYTEPTEIQRDSLPFSLTGADVVAAAKTGSGKTLALVVPLLECLWRSGWCPEYGLGALIISPTRELALQTFTCINHVGKYHHFSCALLIGGTDVSYERNRLGRINIIVCTPGRLLQHMDENEHLSCDQLQVLVLDEADRILDMGFAKQVNAIVANLPKERQTLLFSATQTRNVKDLIRVCTKDPVFVSVHEHSEFATPEQLKQSYLVCEEQEKINTLWSFIRNHKKMKTLVFVASCKQARFLTEALCHLRPGVSVMGLWGTMNQTKRIDTFQKFEDRNAAVLIATDVASRGLDFSDVDWVIQMDAPSTVEDYIHRVGRTARMERKGQAVMFLTPLQEEPMKGLLARRQIPVEKLIVDPNAMEDVRGKLQSVIAQFPELNQFAQKSITSYIRSVYLMRDKSLFNVESVDAAALAAAYGLASAPRVRFLAKKGLAAKGTNDTAGEKSKKKGVEKTKKTEEKGETSGAKETPSAVDFSASLLDDNEEDDLFTVKSADVFNVLADAEKSKEEPNLAAIGRDAMAREKREKRALTKAKSAKKVLNKGLVVNTKKVFDEEGQLEKEIGPTPEIATAVGLDLQEAKVNMKTQDAEDRKRMKELKRAKKLQEKAKRQKGKKKDDELDLGEDGYGSGINSDADLDWLPDPDRKRTDADEDEGGASPEPEDISISKPAAKRRRLEKLKETEAAALALLEG